MWQRGKVQTGISIPRGTPTFLKGQRVPLHEVTHQVEQLQSQKPDGHAHTKNAIMLRVHAQPPLVLRKTIHKKLTIPSKIPKKEN